MLLTNWEQHLLPDLIEKPGHELAEWLGELPEEFQVPRGYRGRARVFVPTLRTSFDPDERLSIKVIILSEQRPSSAVLFWRRLGAG